jgi:hypothetical protein
MKRTFSILVNSIPMFPLLWCKRFGITQWRRSRRLNSNATLEAMREIMFTSTTAVTSFPGIDVYRGGLKPGYELIWEKTRSENLALTGHQINSSPKGAMYPSVNLYGKCTIPEGASDPDVWPGWVEYHQRSGVRIECCPEEVRIIPLGIFKVEDILDPENRTLFEKRVLRQQKSRFDGCTYCSNYGLPLPVLLKRAFEF